METHWVALCSRPQKAPDVGAEGAHGLADQAVALSWWALQFTPQVARVEDAVVLETSASARLFGGCERLLQQLLRSAGQADFSLAYAQGSTSLVALARLWSGHTQMAADDLPLRFLLAARNHLPLLERLGCQTWGQLRALPRGGLARRLGATLLDALDRAYGDAPEVYPWICLPPVFDMPLELQSAVESAPALLFGARRLLAQLQVWLQARRLGVLALELQWQLDARRANALHVDVHHDGGGTGRLQLHTAQATRDMVHVQRLLAEHLARVCLPAPVKYRGAEQSSKVVRSCWSASRPGSA